MSGILGVNEERTNVVAMDDVQFSRQETTAKHSHWKRNLRGCSVVLVTSQKAAIWAHISASGDIHVTDKMDMFAHPYTKTV